MSTRFFHSDGEVLRALSGVSPSHEKIAQPKTTVKSAPSFKAVATIAAFTLAAVSAGYVGHEVGYNKGYNYMKNVGPILCDQPPKAYVHKHKTGLLLKRGLGN
jgi:hypothetical protein